MRALDAGLLHALVQGGRPEICEGAAPALAAGMGGAGLSTPLRLAHFLAQTAYESAYFRRAEEDLDYTRVAAIEQAFPALAGRAAEFVRAPEKLANAAYGGRCGNRGSETGDGWRYRGRGLIQLTGRTNYLCYGARIGEDLLGAPDLAAEPKIAARTALAFWAERGCNSCADADDSQAVTRRINGGSEGLAERARLKRRALALLGS